MIQNFNEIFPIRPHKNFAQNIRFLLLILGGVCLVVLLLFGSGPNFLLAIFSLSVLFIGTLICWRPGEPAVILFIFLFQWLQASIAIFTANIYGMPIDEIAQLSVSAMGHATFLSLVGLLVVVGAFRLAAGRAHTAVVHRAAQESSSVSFNWLLKAYVLSFIGAIIVGFLATISEGLRQPILALLSFKHAIFFIVAYIGFKRGGHFRTLLYVAFAVEFLWSIGGYFSAFQSVFIYTVIAMLSANVRLRPQLAIGGGVLAATAVFAGVVWSAIKVDYRAYVNNGSGKQEIVVSQTEAISTLADMALSVSPEELGVGADRLVRRLTDVEFFGATLNHVPAAKDHTNGMLWWNAVLHPFKPRLFFPNKPALDASAQTVHYSGVHVAGREQGSQVSIGYMSESYVDFGAWGMFFPLALYGAVLGFIYRKVLFLPKFSGLISFGLCVPLLMGGSYLNAEATKMAGHLSVTALVYLAVHTIAGDKFRTLILGSSMRRRTHNGLLVPYRPAQR